MIFHKVSNNLFKQNRKKLSDKIQEKSVIIINSNDQMPRNGDQFFQFRQNSDLFYLTGITQEKTLLIICPDHENEKYREALFILKASKQTEIWEGHKLTRKEATEISGIKSIFWLSDLDLILKDIILSIKNIYLNTNEYPKFSTPVESRDIRMGKEIKEKYPNHIYQRIAPDITELRLLKEDEEILLIERACEITNDAFLKVLKKLKPGLYENEIEAEITAEFIRQQANGHAYAPIIGSGKNACFLHYIDNNQPCNNGDLLLMDFGAEYANYAADCSRTIPVNGKFTNRQKEIYNAVLKILKFAMKLMTLGNTISGLNKQVNDIMENELIKLRLISKEDIKNQHPENPVFKKYFMHGTSHFIGLDVHDVGSKNTVFAPGMVLSCEPGIYISEEEIGIRLENDILITENGNRNLTEMIPVEINDIEQLMKK